MISQNSWSNRDSLRKKSQILSRRLMRARSRNKEIDKVIEKVMKSGNLSEKEKKKLTKLKENLKSGDLQTSGIKPKNLEQLSSLAQAMESAGNEQGGN